MSKIVVGIFDNAEEARDAKHQLIKKGFSENEVDLAKGSSSRYYIGEERHDDENGIERFFRKLFKDDERERDRYRSAAEKGWVITVHADSGDEAQRAADMLDACGAIDIDDHYRKHKPTDENTDRYDNDIDRDNENDIGPGAGIGVSTPTGDTYVDTDETHSGMVKDDVFEGSRRRVDDLEDDIPEAEVLDEDVDVEDDTIAEDEDAVYERDKDDRANYRDNDDLVEESKTIPVIKENIHVDKKEVQTGGVRVRSRIIEKPFEEHIRLREEHVHVERHAVDREATEEELENFSDETIDITENAEVADVKKDARVVEEVSVNKTVDHHDETITNNVRNNEVDVEDLRDKRGKNYDRS